MRTEYTQFLGEARGWVVINTHPHREQIALQHLERQDYVAYCPLIRRRLSHARRVSDVLRPMFPGYVFVKMLSAMQMVRPLSSTIGVRNIVRCGEELSLLDDAFVQSLKAREVDGAICRPENPYQVGQQVKLSGGAFDGLAATIISMHERDRLTVLMDLLNRPVKVMVEETQVAPT